MFGDIIKGITSLFSSTVEQVDEWITSDEERGNIKIKLKELEFKLLEETNKLQSQYLEAQKSIVLAEIQGESWMQRNWRPILMIILVFIVFNNYVLAPYITVLFAYHLPILELPQWLGDLLTYGVSGYMVMLGGQKIAKELKK
jgi:hypothetical protein